MCGGGATLFHYIPLIDMEASLAFVLARTIDSPFALEQDKGGGRVFMAQLSR